MKINAELGRFCGLVVSTALFLSVAGCSGAFPGGASDEATSLANDTAAGSEMTTSALPEAALPETATTQAADLQSGATEIQPDEAQVAAAIAPVAENAKNDLTPRLTALRLEETGANRNMLVADMESAGFYTFTKTAAAEYVLTLEGATIDAEANRVLISPPGKGKIRSVRPVAQGNNIALRIFSESDAFLTVRPRGNQLTVAAFQDEKGEVMAQAAVGEETDAAAKEKEAAKTTASEDELPSETELEQLLTGEQTYTGRLISLDLQDTDIDNALRIIAEVSNLNIIASDDVTGKVTLRLIDVPWDQALDVILKTNGLDKVQEGNVIRIAPVEKLRQEREALRMAEQAKEELEPLRVQYVRVSYAKASAIQSLVETVLSERGTVAYDERTNQLIVKDTSKGLRNVARLVQKVDLRTPQVLIETQIVESERQFARDLGVEMGFFYLRSPETGNPLAYNFPNSVAIGGSAQDADGNDTGYASSYPAADQRTAIDVLLGSADGSKGLKFRLTQGEKEGKLRVVSRPSVAVTNNTPALIKSVTKLRIRIPSGGVSDATGQGASAAGGGSTATETIEIGITLNVTAQASPDYYVLMDIDAKSSTIGKNIVGVDNIPPEVERKATSSVLVSSGQTFALGGIYQISERETVDGTPWLKDIPVLGQFFRSSSVSNSDQELIFFITPRIIEGSFDDAAMKATT